MTVGWRSPLGGPRYEGPIPGDNDKDPQADVWLGGQIEAEIEERRRAEATCGYEGGDD